MKSASQSADARPKPINASPQHAAATATATPWRWISPIQPDNSEATEPHVGSRVQEADHLGAGVELAVGNGGEESARHPEDHGVRVDEEDPEQHLASRTSETLRAST